MSKKKWHHPLYDRLKTEIGFKLFIPQEKRCAKCKHYYRINNLKQCWLIHEKYRVCISGDYNSCSEYEFQIG